MLEFFYFLTNYIYLELHRTFAKTSRSECARTYTRVAVSGESDRQGNAINIASGPNNGLSQSDCNADQSSAPSHVTQREGSHFLCRQQSRHNRVRGGQNAFLVLALEVKTIFHHAFR